MMTAKEFKKFYLEMLKARKAFVVDRDNKKRSKSIEDDLLLFYDEMADIISSLQEENGKLKKRQFTKLDIQKLINQAYSAGERNQQ